MILALDTSTESASAALLAGGRPMVEIGWRAEGSHSKRVGPAITQLFVLSGAKPEDVTGVAVAIGPGSFNGVRVGLSLAKGLAMGLEVPLAGIPTLEAIAFQAMDSGRRVWATVPAGRGELAAAAYELGGEVPRRASDYLRLPATEIASLCLRGDVVSGPGSQGLGSAAAALGVELRRLSPVQDFRRASYLAELGRRYLDAGGESQLDRVEPLYLRRPAAEEKRASRVQD